MVYGILSPSFCLDLYALALDIWYETIYMEAVVAFIDMFNADESKDSSRESL